MKQKLQEGFRVIALTECDKPYDEEKGAQVGTTLALYVLEDHIRDDAIETIRWFKENEVEIEKLKEQFNEKERLLDVNKTIIEDQNRKKQLDNE